MSTSVSALLRPAVRLPIRVFGPLVALMLATVLTACGGADEPPGSEVSGDRDPGVATAAPTAAASEPAPGVEPSKVVEEEPYDGYVSEVYADRDAWICRPDLAGDTCRDLDVTRIGPTGRRSVERRAPAEDPPVDCFYIYPTVSADEGANSDMRVRPDDGEVQTVMAQAAQYARTCRVFAPIYRQVTVAALFEGRYFEGGELAYADVLDAWKTYVTDLSDGRGVIVVGHSQGAMILQRLVAEEIDPNPLLRGRLVAAHLFGTAVQVPPGELVGGTFEEIPGCSEDDETGCVVTWSSYRADSPPPADALFGKADPSGTRALCTDVLALLGRDAGSAISPVTAPVGVLDGVGDVRTRFVSLPRAVEASCASAGDVDYLSVALADPDDIRPVDALQDQTLGPAWGLHRIDMNIAQDDLVEMASRQAAAFVG